MLGHLLIGMVAGIVALLVAVVTGTGILFALAVYAGFGIAGTMASAFVFAASSMGWFSVSKWKATFANNRIAKWFTLSPEDAELMIRTKPPCC